MSASGASLRLRPVNGSAALEALRLAVLEFLAPLSPSARAVYAIELVLEEVLTNQFKYAHADAAAPPSELPVRVEPDEVVLYFEDSGIAFDPLQADPPRPPKSIDDAPVGGLGLVLVRSFAKSATYERRDGRNCLTIGVARA